MKSQTKSQNPGGVSSTQVQKLVLAALMAALSYIATSIIKIPSPMSGYIHPGDGLVFLCGILLGPLYGGLAAGTGSMLADILGGYPLYAPGTFIIKALAAVTCSLAYTLIRKFLQKGRLPEKNSLRQVLPPAVGGFFGSLIVVIGYFLYTCLYLGEGLAAASSIPGNIVQGTFGIITVTVMLPMLLAAPYVRDIIYSSPSKKK